MEPQSAGSEEIAAGSGDDFQLAAGGWKVKAGAAFHMLTALFVAILGLQLIAFGVRFYVAALNLVPYALFVLAAAHTLTARFLYRASAQAALLGSVLAAFSTAALLGWFTYTAMAQMFSLLGFLAVPVAGMALLSSVISIGEAKRATAARRRLADAGMELGY